MMGHTMPKVTLIALWLAMAPTAGCRIDLGGKSDETTAEDDKERDKPRKKDADDDEEKQDKSSKKKGGDDIDIADLMKESESHGVMKTVDLKGIDTSRAPRLGKNADQSAPVQSASWLTLPGGALQIPNPPTWKKSGDVNVGVLVSPDEKAAFLFTTFTSTEDAVQKLKKVVETAHIQNIKWREPKEVQLGPDGLPASVRFGDCTVGQVKAGILFGAVETGMPQKVMTIALIEDTAPKNVEEEAKAIFLGTRKKR